MENNLNNISSLLKGTARQMDAYHALLNLALFSVLRDYSPALVGAIPLDIDVEESGLGIICEAQDLEAFARRVADAYKKRRDFNIHPETISGMPSVVARFTSGGFNIEITGQPKPVTEQSAYRLMLVEARLLEIGGSRARNAIRELKRDGLKTEPAFAQYFDLEGDPCASLLQLSSLSEDALGDAVRKK
ncbi:MAG: DUF4269 domain-containing protein [Chloroflexi bacterium]|nr:DUF4269 domain-containing protein [Chloroflexota bacterium]